MAGSSRYTNCAVTAMQMYCWGQNGTGQAGNGSNSNILLPTPVRWPDAPVGTAAYMVPVTGTSVTAAAGAAVVPDPKVQVRDAFGTAITTGPSVGWVVTSGSSTVSAASSVADGSGNALITWTLAGASGTVNKMEARLANLPSILFTGTVP